MRVALVLVAAVACGGGARKQVAWPDAPLQLRDDSDRRQAIDELWVLPIGGERDAIRNGAAAAIARRITDAIEEDQPFVAETLLFELTALWRDDPERVGVGLAPHAELLHRLRAMFAKSGTIDPTIATLVLLSEVEPAHRDEHLVEIDEILRFADDLAVAENGPHAVRGQPIVHLKQTVLALPLRWLVDRYVTLLVDRQRAVNTVITKQGASMELIRAAHDVLATSDRIAIALARAGRTGEIQKALARLEGIGLDAELRMRSEAVAFQPSADAYYQLARALISDEKTADRAAALAVCLAGIERFPKDTSLLVEAAMDAAALGRVAQPIELYEAAIRNGVEVDISIAARLGRLYAESIARLAFGGRPKAARQTWQDVAKRTAKEPRALWAHVAAESESALGRGLLSQGRLVEAERALVASLDRAPSVDAYETLATVYLKTDRLASASRSATAGLALLGETKGDRYRRAKLERIAGDVMRRAGKIAPANALYMDALSMWHSLGKDTDLSATIVAERRLESAKLLWHVNSPDDRTDDAVDFALSATDVDQAAPATIASAVAFLIQIGRYTDAVDACHRGLGSPTVAEYYKVYMSLWVLADARRRGLPKDRLALEYLESRQGELWYEQLAQAATGRLELDKLRAAATTGPRQAELAFYSAALGLDPESLTAAGARRLFERVVDAGLVMDAEYDLARLYLGK